MYVLIIAATAREITGFAECLTAGKWKKNGPELHIIYTGIGGSATAYSLTREIYRRRPDFIIQAGIAGSFQDALPPGSMAIAAEDVFADLGAMENGRLSDIFDLNLADRNGFPFSGGILPNPDAASFARFGLPLVRSASVNAISSTAMEADGLRKRCNPALESMEGAAFHYVCLMEKIPFLQLRSVSNFAGERDKARWKMKESVKSLNERLIILVSEWF